MSNQFGELNNESDGVVDVVIELMSCCSQSIVSLVSELNGDGNNIGVAGMLSC